MYYASTTRPVFTSLALYESQTGDCGNCYLDSWGKKSNILADLMSKVPPEFLILSKTLISHTKKKKIFGYDIKFNL